MLPTAIRAAALWALLAATAFATSNPYVYPPELAKSARARLSAETAGLPEFLAKSGEAVEAVIVELDGKPALVEWMNREGVKSAGAAKRQLELHQEQNRFLARAKAQGLRLLPRVKAHPDDSKRQLHYRFSMLLNGFVVYVPQSDIPKLRAMPGVKSVSAPLFPKLRVDNSVDYMLGDAFDPTARRTAVYGATEELDAVEGGAALVAIDGHEGQGIILGVIDSGMDYEHPMLGGTGATTPLPQRPGMTTTSSNGKVIYWYNLGGATTLDDHGHGTHVASTAGGFRVDGNSDGVVMTGAALPVGPTPAGVTLHGVAPQAQLMGWPVCAASGSCPGDIELAIEDSVSPTVLSGAGDGNSVDTGVAKPIADVVNLSLGGGTDPASAAARSVNNASLTGLLVAAAAGNDGPGASTVGAPCVATGAICVASVLDPGSTAGTDVLLEGEISEDLCADTNSACALPAPSPETGADSNANEPDGGELQGMTTFHMSGGGPLPDGSVSAHMVYVDRSQTEVPGSVNNRIALLENGTGTFFQIVNPVAVLDPAAILLITDTESATAVAVVNDVPVFTIGTGDGAYLKSIMLSSGAPGHAAVSRQPLRVKASIDVDAFVGSMSGFSSRGPNAHSNGQFRTIKPDVAALGSGVLAATTPSGNPDVALGMMNPTGYTTANGTSMASPHAAGALALVRQRVRALGYDSTDLQDAEYFDKRYRTATITRALIANYASDLRTGRGGDDPDNPNPPYTIHDIGAGLINVDAALRGHAIMTSLTRMFEDAPNEFNAPGFGQLPAGVELDEFGNVLVPLPTASFGSVEVLGINGIVHRFRKVTIEDIDGQGGGSYDLALIDDVLATHPAVEIDFVAADLSGTVTSVVVPSNGAASFFVRVRVDGTGALADGSLISWYVQASHQESGQDLRMPFLYRAAAADISDLQPPADLMITGNEGADDGTGCLVDEDNMYLLSWLAPEGDAPAGYIIERGTAFSEAFFDDASEPLVAGANSTWAGSEQWGSSTDPNSGDEAYFIANAVEQNESLALIDALDLTGDTRAGLELLTTVDTEEGFDFAIVEASVDGGAFQEVARYTGLDAGLKNLDLTPFAGGMARLRFRMSSDLLVSSVGWWVDDIRVVSHDFARIKQLSADTLSSMESAPTDGRYYYRVAALFDVDGTQLIGPFTEPECISVSIPQSAPAAQNDALATREDQSATGNVLADNGSGPDSDPDGDTLVVTSTGSFTATGIGGSVEMMASGEFSYAPPADAFGTAQFEYSVSDGSASDNATTTITVSAVNDVPQARDDAFVMSEDSELSGNVLVENGNGEDTDADGDMLTIGTAGMVTVAGVGGTASISTDGSFSYAPPADTSGIAFFTYTISDGEASNDATVSITVAAVNDAPAFTAGPDQIFAIGQSGAQMASAWARNISAGPGESSQSLSFEVVESSDAAETVENVSVDADGTLSYTLTGANGLAELQVTLTDSGGTANGGSNRSATETVLIGIDIIFASGLEAEEEM